MSSSDNRPARVGMITDQTGALSFMGIANANVAKMVVEDINARGGLLGRPVELFLEDSATDDAVAEVVAAKLVEQIDVDVVIGGIYSSTRQAIKGPVVDQAETLYLYPEQYEGQECHPLIFCTGPVPAQQVEPFFPWLMRETGARTFYMPSADYIWPHTLNKKVREVVGAEGGEIVGEEYFPMDHMDYERRGRGHHGERRRRRVQHDRAARVDAVPRAAPPCRLHRSGWTDRVHLLRRELPEPGAGGARRGPLRVPRLLPRCRRPVQHRAPQPLREPLPGERAVHRGERVHGDVPGAQALGGRGPRGRFAGPGRRHRRARPRPDRRRARAARPRWCRVSTTCA